MVTINIQKKDLWLVLAIGVFVIGASFVIAYGSNNPSTMGHSLNELEKCPAGKILKSDSSGNWECSDFLASNFGSWTNKDSSNNALVKDAVYKATSDGFILVIAGIGYGGVDELRIYTGSTASVTTLLYKLDGGLSGSGRYLEPSGMIPIKSGNYWKVTYTSDIEKIYWIPMGTGQCIKQ